MRKQKRLVVLDAATIASDEELSLLNEFG